MKKLSKCKIKMLLSQKKSNNNKKMFKEFFVWKKLSSNYKKSLM